MYDAVAGVYVIMRSRKILIYCYYFIFIRIKDCKAIYYYKFDSTLHFVNLKADGSRKEKFYSDLT